MQAAYASDMWCLLYTTSKTGAAGGVRAAMGPVLQQPVDGLGADVGSSMPCWRPSSSCAVTPHTWVHDGGHGTGAAGQRMGVSVIQTCAPPPRIPLPQGAAVNAIRCAN